VTGKEGPWYELLRKAHRPALVRVLLIGESAPDPGAEDRRFFYAPVLDRRDNLFRGTIAAFYGCSPGKAGDSKKPWLDRLMADGVYLIDLVPFPVNKLTRKERAKALRDHVGACVDAVRALKPTGVIVCHTPSFKLLSAPLLAGGVPLLHQTAIPFPLANWRQKFALDVRAAIAQI
jgi:hypothetical protein